MKPPVRVRKWSTLTESFLTHKFNLTHMLFPIPVWMRFNRKFPVKVLAWNHVNGSALTVSSHSNIQSFADLGGSQIAVPYWYSMHNIILQMGLRHVGLKPVIQSHKASLKSNEVNLFILPPPEMPSAMIARKIDAYIVAEPYNAIAEMKIDAKIMRFTGDIWKNHPCCVVVMNERLTQSNPVFSQKVVNAIVRAQAWIIKHPLQTAKILSREGSNYLPVSEKILTRVFSGYEHSRYGKGNRPQAIKHDDWDVARIGFQPYPYPSATRLILKEMRHTKMEGDVTFLKNIQIDKAVTSLVDTTFVKYAIHNAGGLQQFGSGVNMAQPWRREETVSL
ncbi:MAG: sulfonate/nitrate/taurine transport system substrate-binding protein [Candidatus Magnetoglobus multicellularis str. Araruama]|uniref:Sulfonate/nitrate/taurine transport system substrate-binding protein n=1 Tax=Candidatus Magnetoglobus multicellularis str. Araruama TaxID=890399 RepID=A0A1V1PCV5_9BACT|nr:MAG: sulfonate/nitrate/taurine transport system substrate-binding protein [Candidatus Magnetoglobus multicellularis str. Araruama]